MTEYLDKLERALNQLTQAYQAALAKNQALTESLEQARARIAELEDFKTKTKTRLDAIAEQLEQQIR